MGRSLSEFYAAASTVLADRRWLSPSGSSCLVEAELVALGVAHDDVAGAHAAGLVALEPGGTEATRRSASASSAAIRSSPSSPGAARTSRCTRFLAVLPSGTFWKNSRGPTLSGSLTAP